MVEFHPKECHATASLIFQIVAYLICEGQYRSIFDFLPLAEMVLFSKNVVAQIQP